MILVDTSIWVGHFRSGDPGLEALPTARQILVHSFVIGELALGAFRDRSILGDLGNLPSAIMATDSEVRLLIEREALFGHGIGYVDAHLLASARLTPGASLWTRDACLNAVASQWGLAAKVSG